MRRIERTLFGALAVLSLAACAEGLTPPAGNTAPRIEGGTFTMGSADRDPCGLASPGLLECDPLVQSEVIPHEVTVATFCIDATEVTIEQYRHCVDRGDCPKAVVTNAGRPNEASFIQRYYNDPDKYGGYPVVGMTHEAAEAYCAFRGGRLPSEVEWEFAATSRGERPTRIYGEGTTFDALIDIGARQPDGNLVYNCGPQSGGIALGGCARTFQPVGTAALDETAQGVKDMAGNAAEWVADEFSFIAYCEHEVGYIVERPGGGQPNHIKQTSGAPTEVSDRLDLGAEAACRAGYDGCEQICRASFNLRDVNCAVASPPPECRSDLQRREFQQRTCQAQAQSAGATAANVVGLDSTCDPQDPAWCDGDPAVCQAFCDCLAAPTPGAEFDGNACINTCLDDYAACVQTDALLDANRPVATLCDFTSKKPTTWCVPREGATGADVMSNVPTNLAFRDTQTSYVVRGGSVADQLACLGRPTRRAVQSTPQALVGFRCAYEANSPACVAPTNGE